LEHYARFYAEQSGARPITLDASAKRIWMDYASPGNVRELRNIVIRLTTKHPGAQVNADQLLAELDWEDAPAARATLTSGPDLKPSVEAARRHLQTHKGFNLDAALRELERSYVEAALEITHGNLSQAARLLGIHRTTLYSRMQANEQTAQEDK